MNLHGHCFIGDQLSTGTGETFRAVSPLDSSPIAPQFYRAGAKEADAALELAEAALRCLRANNRGAASRLPRTYRR